MNNFYLYKFEYKDGSKLISATIIFCDRDAFNEEILREEIKRFYEDNYQTDKIFVIGANYLSSILNTIFIDNWIDTFKGIPRRQHTALQNGLHIVLYGKNGNIENASSLPEGFLKNYLNEGLQNIFIKRGGLVTTEGSHHYVFPSGKHCDKFLRTGNILLFSSEIFFIAHALLKHYDDTIHEQIYCDTSSINSVAFALVELKNRFGNQYKQVPIESFSSYDGLYQNAVTYSKNALLLISASTSANIISYILDKHKLINRENILILYFLGDENTFVNIKDQVICNLTKSMDNPNGTEAYETFKEDNCTLCDRGSFPVEVSGDVFLLEKPQINKITLGTKDPEPNLSGFVKQFKSIGQRESVLKVNFKEGTSYKYEVYIDFYQILLGLNNGNRFPKFRKKLHDYINQYIPSNTRYIITLNDGASEEFGAYVRNLVAINYKKNKIPVLVPQDKIVEILSDKVEGSIVVAGSCISNGKNLLYISRALRKYDKLKIVYFIGIARAKNVKYLSTLKSNLQQGNYGAQTNGFYEVETIFCTNSLKNTPWLIEYNIFLPGIINFLKDKPNPPHKIIEYLEERVDHLKNSMGLPARGLANKLFYPRFTDEQNQELYLRKNFAFFNFENYVEDVSQADIFFTISNIINTLRNNDFKAKKDDKPIKSLNQSAFVRNVLDPANFSRFNDGIIQASLLRSACSEELAYHIDNELSLEMFGTFETLIKYHEQEQGEALIEFLYALAIGKLSLKLIHIQEIIRLVKANCPGIIFQSFADYINFSLIEEPIRKKLEWEEKLKLPFKVDA